MREIILDTETTGFEPLEGHRIIEIGCIEVINRVRTGKHFHAYLNPERDVPEEAFRVHGISSEFLKDKPLFSSVADEFLNFIAEDRLVIHNASFDMKFLNFELNKVKLASIPMERAVDTLIMARKKFPGSPASLDALCKRFNIDLSKRDKHGALLDAHLLAEVYADLTGGHQVKLDLSSLETKNTQTESAKKQTLEIRPHSPSQQEAEAHAEFLKKIKTPVWAE